MSGSTQTVVFSPVVLVVHDKPVIAKVCVYDMDESQVAATFPALLAFERHTDHLLR